MLPWIFLVSTVYGIVLSPVRVCIRFVNVILREILEGDQLNGLRWARHEARMGEMRNADKILMAKRDEKRSFMETQAHVRG